MVARAAAVTAAVGAGVMVEVVVVVDGLATRDKVPNCQIWQCKDHMTSKSGMWLTPSSTFVL